MKTMNARELDRIRKSLEEALKEKNREKIIIGLAELQVLIDEPHYGYRDEAFDIQESVTHDLIELGICEGIENVDELFREVDVAKKQIEKEKPLKVKLTEEEKRVEKIEKLVKEGLTPEEAETFVEKKLLKREGFEVCTICGKVVDVRHGAGRWAGVVVSGKWYHRGCLEEAEAITFEELEEIPFTVFGKVQYCEYCTEPILMSQGRVPQCPPGTRYPEQTPECKWFHGNCFRLMKEEEKEV